MFRRTHEHRALFAIFCGLVFLALWNNAVLWTFCPHLNARSHHCLIEGSSSPSHLNANSTAMSHEHYGDTEMSDMDDEEMPVDASTTAEAKTSSLSTSDIQLPPVFDLLPADTITGSPESCSHCMMHPQTAITAQSAPMVLNNYASDSLVAAASGIVSASLASPLTFVDVHDHGPPGLNGSRYILNSSFRI